MTSIWPLHFLKSAMRRAGANPTDVEITDIINKADNDTGCLDFSVSIKTRGALEVTLSVCDNANFFH